MAADANAPEGRMTDASKRSAEDSADLSTTEAQTVAHGGVDDDDEARDNDESDAETDAETNPDTGHLDAVSDDDEAPDLDAEDEPDALDGDEDVTPRMPRIGMSPVRLATVTCLIGVLALAGVVGWQGYRTYHLRQEQEQRELFLRVGRQGAVNLTTIDFQSVDSDVQRILNSATGQFYDDFLKRSQPFVEVVKKVQSKTVGTVTEAGLESMSPNEARVLVAISVKTSNVGAPEELPRSWRMRIDVQRVDDGAKVSNVLFVPS